MEWPSQNVARGGILHPAKAKFSPEKKEFLNLLIDESKMAITQRKRTEYDLRSYDPLPLPTKRFYGVRSRVPKVLIRPGSSKKRSLDVIAKSGVLEREQFVPKPIVDREAEKEKLRDTMAFGRKPEPHMKKKDVAQAKATKRNDKFNAGIRFEELMREIKDREDFLEEMTRLGQKKKYETLIDLQIQEKMREMNSLDLTSPIICTPLSTNRSSV